MAQRATSSLHPKTKFSISARPGHRDPVALINRCHIRSSSPTILRLQDLPDPKIDVRQLSLNRSQLSHQPLTRPVLPHAQPQKPGGYTSTACLDGDHRLAGCLPTCSRPTMFAQVSCFLSRNKAVFLPSPAVWFQCGISHFHLHPKMATFPHTPVENQCYRLFQ